MLSNFGFNQKINQKTVLIAKQEQEKHYAKSNRPRHVLNLSENNFMSFISPVQLTLNKEMIQH